MISEKTARDVAAAIKKWCSVNHIDVSDARDLLDAVAAVDGNQSFKQSTAAIASLARTTLVSREEKIEQLEAWLAANPEKMRAFDRETLWGQSLRDYVDDCEDSHRLLEDLAQECGASELIKRW